MYKIELLSIAENELSDAFDWYESQSSGLGDRFYKEIKRVLGNIQIDPYLYPIKYSNDIHVVTITAFPYLVIYYVDSINNVIKVLSIFHTSRHPKQF